MHILVTGGSGFIGSNFIRYWASKYPKDQITNLDALTYAGTNGSLNVQLIKGDICNQKIAAEAMQGQDAVFHFAAETHVDRSILDSQIFLKTNVLGTQILLEEAKKAKVRKFIFISTDEVYGSIKKGSFKETDLLLPNSPYAASKASADLLCRSYAVTYDFPVIITRCCNNFGPYQFPEKVIPLFITNLLEGKKIPVYGKGLNVREWIYVLDHCSAIDAVFRKGKNGEIYNIGSGIKMNNIQLAKTILKMLGKDSQEIQYVSDRPGHDFRYSLDVSKLRKLGWKPEYSFTEALHQTVQWYRTHHEWWEQIKNRHNYQKYMKQQYR